MSGHSKWATIKRKKAATDAKRGSIFTRLLKEIQVAARMGGGNPEGNPRLKSAIQSAKGMSVPGDNIERAIKRGTGDLEGVTYEEILYEGYGPGGVAILVKVLTDNKNRTASDIRSMFTRLGGNLAGSNSVAYLFSEKGIFSVPKSQVKEDAIFEAALEAGAEDVRDDGQDWEVVCAPQEFQKVRQALEKLAKEFESQLQLIPSTSVKVSGKEGESLLRLLGSLDEHDDVQSVVANFEMDDKEMEALSKE
jgi:YebC/PmpR family DNA-binding regulatory protein